MSRGPTLSKYHLGCGLRRLEGYVNVDIQETDATDMVQDLNDLQLARESAEIIFSHAFFEHLRRDRRAAHLRAVREGLHPRRGAVCFLGLPDFRAVAEQYLAGGPGIVGPVFDLFNVYRYTHGDPDRTDAYYEQLHKSLFDVSEVDSLLAEAGFPSYLVFSYVFPGEPVAVTMGFFAVRCQRSASELRRRCAEFLEPFDGEFVEASTVNVVLARSRAPVSANYLRARSNLKRAVHARARQTVRRRPVLAGALRRLRDR